jgi:hypothetical protein
MPQRAMLAAACRSSFAGAVVETIRSSNRVAPVDDQGIHRVVDQGIRHPDPGEVLAGWASLRRGGPAAPRASAKCWFVWLVMVG